MNSIITTASAPGRHRRAGHDLHAFSGTNGAIEIVSRLDFADALQRRIRRRNIGGAHRESVARRAVKGRVVAIGDHGIGQHAPAGASKVHNFTGGLMPLAFCDLDDFLPRRRVREQHLARLQSQDDMRDPGTTMVASRSGPVEIIPTSTPSWSEMNFR